jgi:hypothetical protein
MALRKSKPDTERPNPITSLNAATAHCCHTARQRLGSALGGIVIVRILALLSALLVFSQGCANPKRDFAIFGAPTKEEEPAYREKAMEFVRYAQAGEVQKMLAITSTLSHATQTDSIRTLYAEQVVPQFEGTQVTWEPRVKHSHDEDYNPNLRILGTARGKKTFHFTVTVAKERGTLVVINIRKGH